MVPSLGEPGVEPGALTEVSSITTEIAIIAVVAIACAISIVSYWTIRKRK
jgi:hypothetical protein